MREDNIKMDLEEMGREEVNRIQVAQDRVQQLVLVNTFMNHWVK
jgi:hypothetical protein